MSQNVINQGVLIRFAGNPRVYQEPESNCFIAGSAVWGTRSTAKYINIFTLEFFGDYSQKIIVVQ